VSSIDNNRQKTTKTASAAATIMTLSSPLEVVAAI
jgi:hypothetical protein